VLVAELLDYCAAAIERPPFSPDSRQAARQRLTVEHPLQSFSIDYFKPDADPRRRSFNHEYCEALKRQLAAPLAPAVLEPDAPTTTQSGVDAGTGTGVDAGAGAGASDEAKADDENEAWEQRQRFFALPLPRAGPEFHEVTLDNLVRFFRNPCRYLLEKRLGIVLPQGDEELQDDEPFVPDWPARDALAQRLLPRLLEGESLAELRNFARAGIEYPPGRLGDLELEQELQRLEAFAHVLAPLLAEPKLEPVGATLQFAIDGEPWRLIGGFGDLRKSGLIRHRYDDARANDYLNGWIEHLFLNAMELPEAAPRTTWHSRDGHYTLRHVEDARRQLEALLRLYREGLHRPLHLFPKSAWSYVSEGESLSKATGTWQSTTLRPYGESRDSAYRLALRGVDDPLDAEFAECATMVFKPLLDAIEDDRLKVRA
jgi:exodeoxyribonuclease V gamma subunit